MGRPKGSYKLTEMAGDLVWDLEIATAKRERRLKARGLSDKTINDPLGETGLAKLLKETFPKKYRHITPTRLRQLLHKDYLRKKSLAGIDEFEKRRWARILGED
jgi:hypothetical protein